jgi:acetyl esterase
MIRLLVALAMTLLCAGREFKDIEFATPTDVVLTLDAWIPDAARPQPAVIMVHGGGWEAGDKTTYIRPWFSTLTDAGIAWFTINYRLAPQWKHPAAVEDIEAAVRWVRSNARRLGVDGGRLVLMGESAGGHLASLAALRGKVKVAGLISFYGIHDVALWAEQRAEVPRNIRLYLRDSQIATLREASPVTYVGRGSPPILVIHGTADTGVPWRQSEVLCEAARRVGAQCEMQLIEGAPHGVENWEQRAEFQVWKRKVVEWLRGLWGTELVGHRLE